MKTIFKNIILIMAAFSLVACGDDGNEIKRTLKPEKDLVELDVAAQTVEIAVQVDEGDQITAKWEGDAWGSATVEGSKVKITVKENDTPAIRKASVHVALADGWRTASISVTQGTDKNEVSIMPESIKFDFMGGKEVVKIETVLGKWGLTAIGGDWLDVEIYEESNEIVVSAGENTFDSEMTATLVVNSGGMEHNITVTQNAALGMLLPYLDFDTATRPNIEAFEKERHSIALQPAGGMAFTISFQTRSTSTPKIAYSGFRTYRIVEAYMGGDYTLQYLLSDEFKVEFEEYGFEFLGASTDREYYWMDRGEDAEWHVQAIIMPSYGSIITYTQETDRPSFDPDAETYEELPLPGIAYGSTVAEVKAWELENGGRLNKDEDYDDGISHYADFFIDDGSQTNDVYMRWYYSDLKKDRLFNAAQVRYSFHKSFTKVAAAYRINAHYAQLLESNGYQNMTVPDGIGFLYMYKKGNEYLGLTAGEIVDEEGNTVSEDYLVIMNYIHKDYAPEDMSLPFGAQLKTRSQELNKELMQRGIKVVDLDIVE